MSNNEDNQGTGRNFTRTDGADYHIFQPNEHLLQLFQGVDGKDGDIDSENLVNSNIVQALTSCKYYLPSEITLTSFNTLNVMHINIRSLKSKLDELLNFLSVANCEFDIMSISETWLNDDVMQDYNVSGYTLFYNNRENMRGGGVAIYVNNKFKCIQRPDLDINNNLIVSKFIELEIINNKNVIIGCIYRSPNNDSNTYFRCR